MHNCINVSISLQLENCGGVCGRVVNTWNFGSDVWGSSLAPPVFPLDKEIYSTLSLFTQVYKWVPSTYCWGVTL